MEKEGNSRHEMQPMPWKSLPGGEKIAWGVGLFFIAVSVLGLINRFSFISMLKNMQFYGIVMSLVNLLSMVLTVLGLALFICGLGRTAHSGMDPEVIKKLRSGAILGIAYVLALPAENLVRLGMGEDFTVYQSVFLIFYVLEIGMYVLWRQGIKRLNTFRQWQPATKRAITNMEQITVVAILLTAISTLLWIVYTFCIPRTQADFLVGLSICTNLWSIMTKIIYIAGGVIFLKGWQYVLTELYKNR